MSKLSKANDRKLNVTLLSSEWRSSTDGDLSTINRELAIQLAKHSDVEVTVFLPQCSEEDRRNAASHNVQLLVAERLSGMNPVDCLMFVPDIHLIDFVVGHGVTLGRQAQSITRYRHCKWIQVVHTAPEELGMYKSVLQGEQVLKTEEALCGMADQVVAIGSKLADTYKRYLRSSGKEQNVFDVTPGIFSEFLDVEQVAEERRTFSVLLIGSDHNCEDFILKGYDLAAQAIAELKDKSYQLRFVGAPRAKEDEIADKILQLGIDRNQLGVTAGSFSGSRKVLANLFLEVDLAIMPSTTDEFGLMALEALSAGLPVLVSGNSGLGEALKEVLLGSQCVIDSEDPKDWAKMIKEVREKKREVRLSESRFLREKYLEKYSWEEPIRRLVERMHNLKLARKGSSGSHSSLSFTKYRLFPTTSLTHVKPVQQRYYTQALKDSSGSHFLSPIKPVPPPIGWTQVKPISSERRPVIATRDERPPSPLFGDQQFKEIIGGLSPFDPYKALKGSSGSHSSPWFEEYGLSPTIGSSQVKRARISYTQEEELLEVKEKTMEEFPVEGKSLQAKGFMAEENIRQDSEASSAMEIPSFGSQAKSLTRMKSLLYTESEECKVDHQGTTWNLTDIQAGGCITFTQDAVSMPLLFGCKLLEPTVDFPPLNKDERLVSSVIELTCDEQPDIHFTGQSKGEVVIALSHSAPKLGGYEVVIGELVSSDSSYEWKDLETTNIWQIPDIKDDFAKLRVPYSEAKVTTCGVFAVIYRLKSYIYSTRVSGNEEITHKIPEYPEVSVTIPAENVRDRRNLELILKVQEIPQQWFDCGEEFAGPVLHIKCPQITDLVEPATITLPLLLQEDKDELSKFSATDLRVFKCRSGDERADWDEITMQLPNAVELVNGVVIFQVKHFCRFTVWPSKKRRLRDRRLAHRINRFTRPFPLEAGFFACLCNAVDKSPGHAQLRLYCYPARLEPKVKENACSAHDIDRYGNGDSLLTLFHGDELRAKLWRGSEVKKTLKLRFRNDRKFEVDAIVRVLKEGTPHVKFLQHLREQSPRKLCELTIATQCQRKARDPHHAKQEVPNSEELERLSQQVPSNEELEWLSHKLKKWKTVGRRLGIEEATLTAISKENEEYFEKTYQMLLKWTERESSAATYQVIHEALCHELVERADLAEELYSRKLR